MSKKDEALTQEILKAISGVTKKDLADRVSGLRNMDFLLMVEREVERRMENGSEYVDMDEVVRNPFGHVAALIAIYLVFKRG